MNQKINNTSIDIDRLTLRLPKGWQGDPVMLARAVANHLQNHPQHLSSQASVDLSIKGQFNGQFNQLKHSLNQKLNSIQANNHGDKHD